MCEGKDLDDPKVKDVHRKLSSDFIAYKLSKSINTLPMMTIKQFIDKMNSYFGYEVKYGKAWKSKQATFKMMYGD
jgi:hypothetical protein